MTLKTKVSPKPKNSKCSKKDVEPPEVLEPLPKDILEKVVKKPYSNCKIFREQLAVYYKTNIMTNELAINVVKIAEGLSYNWRFLNYTKSWKEDMIGDAIVKMYAALESKKFKLELLDSNPFSLASPLR